MENLWHSVLDTDFHSSPALSVLILFSETLTHDLLALTLICKRKGHHLSFLGVCAWRTTSMCKLWSSQTHSERLLTWCSLPLFKQHVWGLTCLLLNLSKCTVYNTDTCPVPSVTPAHLGACHTAPVPHLHSDPLYFCLNYQFFQDGSLASGFSLLRLTLLSVPEWWCDGDILTVSHLYTKNFIGFLWHQIKVRFSQCNL